MRKFFISSHGRLASGIKTSLEILLGNADCVTVFDAYVDQDRVEDHVEAFLETVGEEDQAILLSDLFGGSVNQVLYRYLDRPNTFLVSGVNLGLVIELVAMKDFPVDAETLDAAIESAKGNMQRCVLDVEESASTDEDFF